MIRLTDNALLHLRSLRDEHNKKFVRLQVKGGGCAGFEYEWSFADEETRNDVIVDDILLIDRINELYLTGMVVVLVFLFNIFFKIFFVFVRFVF